METWYVFFPNFREKRLPAEASNLRVSSSQFRGLDGLLTITNPQVERAFVLLYQPSSIWTRVPPEVPAWERSRQPALWLALRQRPSPSRPLPAPPRYRLTRMRLALCPFLPRAFPSSPPEYRNRTSLP